MFTAKVHQKERHKALGKNVKEVLWTNLKKDHLRHTVDKVDNPEVYRKAIADEVKEKYGLYKRVGELNEQIRLLEGQIGNLKVQNADYSQIVEELSSKLKLYEQKYGTVFKPKRNS